MLRTRLWMGALLIALTAGVLTIDQRFAGWYPFLFFLVLALTLLACVELRQLIRPIQRPSAWLCYAGVVALVLANWMPTILQRIAPTLNADREPWPWIAGGFGGVVLLAFLVEMAVFRAPGESVTRIALTVWTLAYLGLLPCFLVQLRWLGPREDVSAERRATTALALAIFVPKCCDIGAYFTGRFFGRHRMAPVLSPKKTWEGAAGGLAASAVAAVALDQLGPAVAGGVLAEAGVGLVLGAVGMLGDLAESLIKRDSGQKDASQVVPGFGGVLDVVDSIVFAAPVAYWLLK
jgi:phosphatidate cytidylyltransferase